MDETLSVSHFIRVIDEEEIALILPAPGGAVFAFNRMPPWLCVLERLPQQPLFFWVFREICGSKSGRRRGAGLWT